MKEKQQAQIDYTAIGGEYQLRIPLDCEITIAKDDLVRLLSAIMDMLDYGKVSKAYSQPGRKGYPPRILLKICVYGYIRCIFYSRELEAACRENLKFMYLLEGRQAPDHNTIARFRSQILRGEAGQDFMRQLVEMLIAMGYVDLAAIFIDGTKIEANANKYTFVWKKSTIKNLEKLLAKIEEKLPELLQKADVKWYMPQEIEVHHLKKLLKKLHAQIKASDTVLVSGRGSRKTPIQRAAEAVEAWLDKYKQYSRDISICADRNSYCKTDHDATFMHMKEDTMRNGQLKPGYNVNVATANEFILGHYISADRNDVHTLIPFMEKLHRMYPNHHPGKVVVDSGYESEENYCWFERLEDTELYVKPANHEIRKSKKYRTDISRRENMPYDPERDAYTCAAGKAIYYAYDKRAKSASGMELITSVYECDGCQGCPLKEKCIRACGSKKPMEERSKVLYVSKRFAAQREAMEAKINTPEGKLLGVNRTIQAEGTFAQTKENMNFRRFLLRGTAKVEAEWSLLSLAANILKLHHKIVDGRLGTSLVIPARFSAAL